MLPTGISSSFELVSFYLLCVSLLPVHFCLRHKPHSVCVRVLTVPNDRRCPSTLLHVFRGGDLGTFFLASGRLWRSDTLLRDDNGSRYPVRHGHLWVMGWEGLPTWTKGPLVSPQWSTGRIWLRKSPTFSENRGGDGRSAPPVVRESPETTFSTTEMGQECTPALHGWDSPDTERGYEGGRGWFPGDLLQYPTSH